MARTRRGELLEDMKLQHRLEKIADEIEAIVKKDLLLKRLEKLVDETEALITKPKRRK